MRGMPKDIGPLHFIGIGGIGMSGIAEILITLGYTVQGSDQAEGANVKRLREQGAKIFIGHEPENITSDIAAIVTSSAIKQDNKELQTARDLDIPVIRRAEMLAELMRMKWAVAIGGTHGKTTTTAMVGQMLEATNFDPTVINGGIVNAYGTNVRMGDSDIMVVEADESDGTFTRLPASVAVVTNMDPEHMEHYGNFENVKAAYRTFIHNLPFYGYAVLCIDHPEVQALVPSVKDRKIITYGFNPQADVHVSNVKSDANGSVFDVTFAPKINGGEELVLRDVHLPMLGEHNVQNCLVALAIAHEMGAAPPMLKKGIGSFTGVKRRFTKTGETHGVTIIDDYAHHPIEIETMLKTARTAVAENGAKVICVMQPHRYSRLDDLFEDFCKCFNEADTVLITDVYEAGETPIENRDKLSLVEGIKSHGHRDVHALPSRAELAHTVAKHSNVGDYVILMGAGDITSWAYELPDLLEAELAKAKGSAA